MIKATELRKGNLLILNISYKDNIHRVDEIYTDEVKVTSIEDGGCFHRMKVSSCKPIPLTPEWLERCGFKASNGIEMKNDLWFIVHVDEGRANLYDIRKNETVQLNMPCQFVHQLQNLYFVLTGEELTIKEPA